MKSLFLFLLLPFVSFSSTGEIDLIKNPVVTGNFKLGSPVIKVSPSSVPKVKIARLGERSFRTKKTSFKIANVSPLSVAVVSLNDTIKRMSLTFSTAAGAKLKSTLIKKYGKPFSLTIADSPGWIIDNGSFSMYETSTGYHATYRELAPGEASSLQAEQVFSELPVQ